jgi:hypothetical protein
VFFRDYFKLKEDGQYMNKPDIEVRLHTDCCCGKALSVLYSEFVSVVLFISMCVCSFVYQCVSVGLFIGVSVVLFISVCVCVVLFISVCL